MKRHFFLILALLFAGSFKLLAQAYDGLGDTKIFAGASMVGDKFGIEIQYDNGFSDLFSFGSKLTLLLSKANEDQDESDNFSSAFAKIDLAAFLRLHFSRSLNLSERIDPYLGAEFSLKALGGHAGVKYNFSETAGLYLQAGHYFSGSFWAAEDGDFGKNLFAKKTFVSAGLTINMNTGRGYR